MPDPVNQTGAHGVYGRAPRRLDRLLERLLPSHFLVCRERGSNGGDLCGFCLEALPWLTSACVRCALPLGIGPDLCGECQRRPPPQAVTRAAFVYRAPLDRLLPRVKFHGDLAGLRLLSALMGEATADADRPQAIVPIPLHPSRLRRRGYDQALELARPLSLRLALPLRDDLLRRVRATAAQSRLDAGARRRNLRGAFAVVRRGALPAHAVLIDDVMTTGATARSAAMALLRAGVARVDVWVCARVP